jgi:site-specific DNA-methyltransferase (adenine-specific)
MMLGRQAACCAFYSFMPNSVRVGPHALLQGDYLKILPELDPGSVDVVVTSPPYNLDLDYGAYEDKRSEADYLGWMVEVAQAVFEPQS